MEEAAVSVALSGSQRMVTAAFFRSTVLITKLRELNKKLKDMRPEEIIETLGPDFFERLFKQRVYDKDIRLKTVKQIEGRYSGEDKGSQSALHTAQDNLDDVDAAPDAGDEGKAAVRSKAEKTENLLGDKDALKEALEKQTLTLWITRLFICSMFACVLGLALICVVEFVRLMNPFRELRDTFIIKEYSIRKTSEVLLIKYNIRSLLFLNE